MKRVILVVFFLVVVGVVAIIKYLPWWVSVALFAVFVATAKYSIRPLLTQLFLLPFKAKGAVLRGATVQVHSVRSVPPPPPSSDPSENETPKDDSEAGPRYFYEVDLTVTPKASDGPFQLWGPGELQLVGLKGKPVCDSDDEAETLCSVKNLEVQQEGRFQSDEGMKFPGQQRLKLLAAVRPGVSQLQCRYYFELFGTVDFPAPTSDALSSAA